MNIYECLGIDHLLMDIPIPEYTILENLDEKYFSEAYSLFKNIDYISLRVSLSRDEQYLQVMEIGLNTPKKIDKIAQYIQKAIKYRILFVFVYQDHYMILWRNFKLTDSTEYVYTDAVSYCTDWFYEETLNDDVLWTCNSIKINAEKSKISPLAYKKKNKKDDGGLEYFRDVISNVYRLCSTMINRDLVCARFLMDWFDSHAMGHRVDLNHVICQSILEEMYMIIDDHLFFDKDRLEVLCSTIENPNYRFKVKIGRTGRVPWRYFEDIAFPATMEDEYYTITKLHEVIDSDGQYYVDVLNDETVSLNAQDIKKTQVEQKNLWYRMTEKQLAQKRREEEYRKAVEEERRQEEIKQAEEACRKAEETKRAEEARRKAEETKRAEEARRKAEEAKRAEEAHRKAEEAKRVEEARRKAEEAKRAEEARRKAEEAKRAEEACRKAEEAKRAEQARLKAEEAKRAEEARRKAEEVKRKEEVRLKAEEKRAREYAEYQQRLAEEAERQRKLEEEQRKALEAKCAEEARHKAEASRRKDAEIKRKEEEKRKAEEAKRIEEARRKAEEARKYSERELQRAKAERRKNERCQHCGGEFKSFLGLFAKKCRNCGLPKDY